VRKYFGKDFIFDAPKILQILKQIGPDIVYQRVGCAYTGIAAFYCKNFQKRFIWHISHEKLLMPFKFTFNKSFFANLADHKCFAYGIKNADIILAQTDRQKKLLKQNYNIECDAVIPNFHPRPKTHWDQKRPDKVNVVWVANWKHWKHPEWFVEIARQMQEEKRAKFIMIGRAGLNPHQKNKLLNEINLLSNLQYLGELPFDQVNEILSQSHIFISTSDHEGFSNTFIQAWLHGLPVLSLRVDPDGIIEKHGLGYRCGTIQNLVNALKLLLEDPSHLYDMAYKARAYALQHFTVKYNMPRLLEFFTP